MMKEKSKILLISAVFPPEPVVSAIISKDVAKNLVVNGNSVVVICPTPTRPKGFNFDKEFTPTSYEVNHLCSYTNPNSDFIGRFTESYSFGKQCANYIKKNHKGIKSIYANTWPIFSQLFVVNTAKKYNIPIVLHVQDIYPEAITNKIPQFKFLINFVLMPLEKLILNRSTIIVSISENSKEYLSKTRKINKNKISVVINWQDEKLFLLNKQSEKLPSLQKNNPFTFMYLGNIGPVAGCDLLIDAFAQTKISNTRLVIAGSGSMKEQLINKSANLEGVNIEFWPVPDGKVPQTQAQTDIMVLSARKGTGLTSIPSKLPAYMFSSRPIIASVDSGSVTAKAIREAGCGWVVDPENIEDLSKAMKKSSRMPISELQQMGLKGREYAIKHFSREVNLAKLVSIIENVVN